MNSKMKEAQPRPSDALEAPLAKKLSKSSRLSLADSPSKSKSTPPQSHRADPPSTAISNQRLLRKNVVFISRTDEHGEKIASAAAARGSDPSEHCDAISQA